MKNADYHSSVNTLSSIKYILLLYAQHVNLDSPTMLSVYEMNIRSETKRDDPDSATRLI